MKSTKSALGDRVVNGQRIPADEWGRCRRLALAALQRATAQVGFGEVHDVVMALRRGEIVAAEGWEIGHRLVAELRRDGLVEHPPDRKTGWRPTQAASKPVGKSSAESGISDVAAALETQRQVQRLEDLARGLPVDINGPVISIWRTTSGSFVGSAGVEAKSFLEAVLAELKRRR